MTDQVNSNALGFKFADYPNPVNVFSKRKQSNVMSKCLGSFLGIPVATGGTPYSVMAQTVMETHWDSMRVGIFNADNNAVAGVKVAIGSGTTLGGAAGTLGLDVTGQPINGNGFLQATFTGAATGTLTTSPAVSTGAGAGNIGGANCSITYTDWMAIPSVDRVDGTSGLPVTQIILTYPAGVNRTFMQMDAVTVGSNSINWTNEGSANVAPYNRPYRVMVAAANDAVANAAFMLIANGACARTNTDFPPIIIEAVTRTGLCETIVLYADSIGAGTGAGTQYCGWLNEFQRMESTLQNPISICNLAVAGTALSDWINRITTTVGFFKNVNVVVPSLSPNGLNVPINSATIILNRKYSSVIKTLIQDASRLFITCTVLATNFAVKAYGNTDVLRVNWNNEKLAGSIPCFDPDAVTRTATVDTNGQYGLQPALTFDGIHLNTPGYIQYALTFRYMYKTL